MASQAEEYEYKRKRLIEDTNLKHGVDVGRMADALERIAVVVELWWWRELDKNS